MDYGLIQIPESEYNRITAVRSSALKALKKSPAHCRWAETHIDEDKTPALKMGELVHCKLFLPDKYLQRYCFVDIKRKTNAGKEQIAELELEYGAGNVLTPVHDQQVSQVVDGCWRNKAVRSILESLEGTETTAIWQDSTTKMDCKARYDGWNKQINAIVDLKTTIDASKFGFSRAINNYDYALSAVHYIQGAQALDIFDDEIKFIFIAVEKEAPFCSAVYLLDDQALMAGKLLHESLMNKYAECVLKDEWAGYSDKIESISLPEYGIRRIENEYNSEY